LINQLDLRQNEEDTIAASVREKLPSKMIM